MQAPTTSALAAIFVFIGCKSEPAAPPPPPPLPESHVEVLRAFVKREACEATTCNEILCENFSDGQTKGSEAHIARCRWTDTRNAGTPKRCAYVHYAVEAARNGFSEIYLSTPASTDTCQSDKKFNELLQGTVGYSGKVP